MISDKEFIDYEEAIRKQKKIEQVYEIIEREKIYDVFPNYDLQDNKLIQDILEVYKILFWGFSALISTILWLYFFIN